MVTVRCMPCAVCGNEHISEYMVNKVYSFRQCDNCKINAPASDTAFRAAEKWNDLMIAFLDNRLHRRVH